ncbi:hypothetical protein ABTZ03_26110 [Kitasatospora sp. NPDC096077]|uniref:hypothetical protein n=1 Tax=Kitasatospora sp. NPDC096077 TaxID=3155544 RepID=UPI003321F6E8
MNRNPRATTRRSTRPVPAWRDPGRFTGAYIAAALGGTISSALVTVLGHLTVGWH